MNDLDGQVAGVRAFNRFYTPVIGLLADGLLGTAYNLTEARVLFELAGRHEVEVATVRTTLGVDAGYLSRIVQRFERDGLIERERSATDGRRQIIRLAPAGREAFATLDHRSAGRVREILERVPVTERETLLEAMRVIQRVLASSGTGSTDAQSVEYREPRPGDLGWIIQRHGALYASEYGWNHEFEALVTEIVLGYSRRSGGGRERAWIAERAGERVGCVLCTERAPETAQLRCLLVEPGARAAGIGTALVDHCVRFARDAGYSTIMLWTNEVLTAARRRYERAGFAMTDQGPVQAFGHDLIEQTWWLKLR